MVMVSFTDPIFNSQFSNLLKHEGTSIKWNRIAQSANQMERAFTTQQTEKRVPVNVLVVHRAQDEVQMVLVLYDIVRPDTYTTSVSNRRTLARLSLSFVLMK